jgi:hypothetical protein
VRIEDVEETICEAPEEEEYGDYNASAVLSFLWINWLEGGTYLDRKE